MNFLQRRGAFYLGFVALGTRLFCAVALDQPQLLNAGWMTALSACLLTALLALCLSFLENSQNKAPLQAFTGAVGANAARVFCLMLCLFMIYDTAFSIRLLGTSAQYMALNGLRTGYLMFAGALAGTLCAMLGLQAIGGACKLLLWAIAALFVILLFAQAPSVRVGWLTPVWGPGIKTLIKPLPALCGMATGVVALWLFTTRDAKTPFWRGFAGMMIFIGLVLGVMLAIYASLAPAMPDVLQTRAFQLDRILTNGRIAVSLQFILVLLWYISLSVLMVFNLTLAVSTACVALPGINFRWGTVICAALAFILSLTDYGGRDGADGINTVRLIAVGGSVLAATIAQIIKKSVKRRPPA